MRGPIMAHEVQTSPHLSVDGLVVRFGKRTALDGVSFDVHRGEIFGLLGPNGSGKSTTFHVLTGLLGAASGQVRLDGVAIEPTERALRRQMGVVFQAAGLDPHLTCRENLRCAARLHRVPSSDREPRIDELLDFAELSDRGHERVKTLSGGMKRRLEIARALVHRPRLLVLDEPTVGLDEASFERTWERLLALRQREGVTLLLTTHRPEEAARCDRLALLDQGKVLAIDTPEKFKAAISGDIITLVGKAPDELAEVLLSRFSLTARRTDEGVVVVVDRGHEWIPRLVEALPNGRLSSVSLKRPSMADVFLKLSGRTLFDLPGAV